MQEEYGYSEAGNTSDSSEQGDPPDAHVQPERRHETNTEYAKGNEESPEEEVDRQMRAFGRWLLDGIKNPTNAVQLVVVVVGIVGIIIAGWQLSSTANATREATQVEVGINMPLIFPVNLTMTQEPSKEGAPKKVRLRADFHSFGATEPISPKFSWGLGDIPQARSYLSVNNNWIHSMWSNQQSGGDDALIPIEEATALAAQVAAHERPLYIYGVIEYLDVFPKSKDHRRRDHRVEWCLQVSKFVMPHGKQDGTIRADVSRDGGSCFDEGCEKYNNNPPYDPQPRPGPK